MTPKSHNHEAEQKAMLRCPNCKAELDHIAVLDRCSVSWPNQQWLYFKCTNCKEYSHVWVTEGSMALGELDGAPGPCFMADCEIKVEGLKVVCSDGGIKCRVGGRVYTFRAS